MNILERAKNVLHGISEITQWIGEGGNVVELEEAQARANTCLTCPLRDVGFRPEEKVAARIKQFLEMKSKLDLKVQGEKSLGFCNDCGCSLQLLIWQEQERVYKGLTDAEKSRLPTHCWKLKQP